MASVWYCTREDVKSAGDFKLTAYNDVQVDRAIEAASRSIEGMTHRKFYPQVATRYFDWPNEQYARSWRLWLDQDEIISVTSLVSGGTTISASDYNLEPVNSGPPYTHVEIDLGSDAAFSSGDTHQHSIAITGVFGHSANEAAAGALAEALDDSETGVDVTNSAAIGVGDIIKVDSERMIVTGKAMIDTTQNLATAMTNLANDQLVDVADGTAFFVGETILIDSERMLIVDIAGNNLIVRRAHDGSALAAHNSSSDVYAARSLTVERAALGTTVATHSSSAAITRHVVPGSVRALAVGLALAEIAQEGAAYARTAGSGDSEREARAIGLAQLADDVYTAYGRKARMAAV